MFPYPEEARTPLQHMAEAVLAPLHCHMGSDKALGWLCGTYISCGIVLHPNF